jgi:hypothetical protein
MFAGKLYIHVCDIVGQTQIDVRCYVTLPQLNIIVDFFTSTYKMCATDSSVWTKATPGVFAVD